MQNRFIVSGKHFLISKQTKVLFTICFYSFDVLFFWREGDFPTSSFIICCFGLLWFGFVLTQKISIYLSIYHSFPRGLLVEQGKNKPPSSSLSISLSLIYSPSEFCVPCLALLTTSKYSRKASLYFCTLWRGSTIVAEMTRDWFEQEESLMGNPW